MCPHKIIRCGSVEKCYLEKGLSARMMSCRKKLWVVISLTFATTLFSLVCASACTPLAEAETLLYAEKIAKTSMNLWNVTGPAMGKYTYELGVLLRGIELLWRETDDPKYFAFMQRKLDRFVNENGTISTYSFTDYTLDNILTGRILFILYKETHQEKYRKAIDVLRQQLKFQPRTNEGGFWHKKIYPFQMWLDGLYMAGPFYAEFAATFDEPEDFTDVALQFKLMEKHARDPMTGLLYHGYDESRKQNWSDPITGNSASFWGRGVGWYAMALVDTLDYFPRNHPERSLLVAIVRRLARALEQAQDPESGLWWQVLDKGGAPGNYLEASASCMFVYCLAKGVKEGYLPARYYKNARGGYAGITSEFIVLAANGGVNLTRSVAVGGLGGNPWRNGTYAYYISEGVVTNDPKGVGSFMMASIQIGSRSRGRSTRGSKFFLH